MAYLWHKLTRALKNIGLVFLLANVVISSVPRCGLIVSNILGLGQDLNDSDQTAISCHGETPSSKEKAQISEDEFCACALLEFVVTVPQSFDPQCFIQFIVNSVVYLDFIYLNQPLSSFASVDPPYPKA